MQFKFKIFSWLLSILLVVIIILFFIFKIAFLSLPESEIEFESNAFKDEVSVYKNQYSIPHIISKNEADAYFMLGFMHAQDRLWQMETLRRKANGTLSEVLGKDYVELDVFNRLIGFSRISKQVYSGLDEQSKNILEYYTNGINFFIEENKKRLPFEFNTLDFKPNKWIPQDCIAIFRLFAFEESSSFWNDLAMSEIAETIGIEKAKQLLPYYNLTEPFIFDEQSSVYQSVKSDTTQKKDSINIPIIKTASNTKLHSKIQLKCHSERSEESNKFLFPQNLRFFTSIRMTDKHILSLKATWNNSLFNEGTQEFSQISKGFQKIKEKYYQTNAVIGSTAWSVKNNQNKNAVLVSDLHLPLSLPPRLYQVHITSSEFNVVGFSLPGTPLILNGRNDFVSWGIANAMFDDIDFYSEKVDSANSDYYYNSKNKKLKFKFIPDTLKIKNQVDSVFYIRFAERSAVISDLQNLSEINENNPNLKQTIASKYTITFNWTGQYKSDEFLANNKILKSKSWYQIKTGLDSWAVPAANFIFADKKGNIGNIPAGLLPNRESSCVPWMLNPGWQEFFNWQKPLKVQNILTISNPQKNYIIAANNPISRKYSQFITNYWDIPSRAIRCDSLLSRYENYTVNDAQNMLHDSYSPYSKQILSNTLPYLQKYSSTFNTLEKNSLIYLKYWDNILSPNQIPPTIYNVFLEKLILNTFADELCNSFNAFINTTNLHYSKILEILEHENSEWFDNKITNKIELKEHIIIKSFKDAVEQLRLNFSDMLDDWKFNKLNNMKLRHSFSQMNFYKYVVESPVLDFSGDFSTLNYIKIKNQFDAIGSAGRMICSMNENKVYLSLPGGVSGQPLSGNYTDQLQLWLSGGYIEIPFTKEPTEDYTLFIKAIPER